MILRRGYPELPHGLNLYNGQLVRGCVPGWKIEEGAMGREYRQPVTQEEKKDRSSISERSISL